MMESRSFDPTQATAVARHEFGEHGGVNMSIEASTTFTVMQAHMLPEIFQGRRGPDSGGCFLYGRHYNPTVYALGRQLAALEGAEAAYCTSSGMGAISAAVLQCADQGDHVIVSQTVYGGTYALFNDYLPKKTGIRTTFVDITDLDAVRRAFRANTRMLFAETVANPTLQIADIEQLAKIAHQHGVPLVIDNTFTPLIVTPINLGADIVVHSMTKFINGASDIIAGAICGRTEFISKLMDLHTGSLMLLGPTMDPHQAALINSRLPHLPLRMAEHSRRALIFAERLQAEGAPVIYPGLPNHEGHELLRRMSNPGYGYGGLLCVDLGTLERAHAFMENLQNQQNFGYMAVSLGYSDSLISASGATTSSEVPDDMRSVTGIGNGLVRISVGITGNLEQRWQQLHRAWRAMA
jgi:methionine-gamma-lyase